MAAACPLLHLVAKSDHTRPPPRYHTPQDVLGRTLTLIGRIVRRRAAKVEAARHAEATEIARQKAERRIADALCPSGKAA
jgi:hypothetical protein